MKLEQQVTSLELSKRLRELGVKQESLFYWIDGELTSLFLVDGHKKVFYFSDDKEELLGKSFLGFSDEFISAYTVAELGIGIEKYLDLIYFNGRVLCLRETGKWAETEADIRAILKIHLLENKLIQIN